MYTCTHIYIQENITLKLENCRNPHTCMSFTCSHVDPYPRVIHVQVHVHVGVHTVETPPAAPLELTEVIARDSLCVCVCVCVTKNIRY